LNSFSIGARRKHSRLCTIFVGSCAVVERVEIRLCIAETGRRSTRAFEETFCGKGAVTGSRGCVETDGRAAQVQGTLCHFANTDGKFYLGDLSNDITLTSFRLLVSDLLALFQPLNEGVMNVLSTPDNLSHTDLRSLF
jgi:ANTH domain